MYAHVTHPSEVRLRTKVSHSSNLYMGEIWGVLNIPIDATFKLERINYLGGKERERERERERELFCSDID